MTKFSRHTVPFFGLCTGLSCLVAVACGGDKDNGATPTVTAGSSSPSTPTPAVPGATPAPAAPAPGVPSAMPPTSTPGTMAPPSSTPGPAPTPGQPAVPSTDTPATATNSVLQYHGNAKRDGNYVDAAFTRAAAANLKPDTTFNATITGAIYAQPLYFENGPGGKDVVITATEENEVSAFDAASGTVAWRKVLGPTAPGRNSCGSGNINPLGITGTPVIDAASRTLFVASVQNGEANNLIYALSLDDGSTRTGWPVRVDNIAAAGTTFVPDAHNQRGALLIVGDMLYVPYGGRFGDCGPYHGWVVGVPINNPAAPIAFATTAHGGGMWAPGAIASDGTSVYAATGNTMAENGGLFSTPNTWGHGNAILRLGKDLKTIAQTQTTEFFAAQDWQALDQADEDLGGSGPVLFDVPGASPSQLAIALGKNGAAYLLDRTNLGGMGGEIETKAVSTNTIIQAAAAYTTPTGTFVTFRGTGNATGCATGSGALGAIKVSATTPPTMTVAWCAGPNGNTSPIVTTTDGSSESIVWYAAGANLLGFNGENGTPVYTGNGVITGRPAKFQTPIAAKGRLFFATDGQILAFTLR